MKLFHDLMEKGFIFLRAQGNRAEKIQTYLSEYRSLGDFHPTTLLFLILFWNPSWMGPSQERIVLGLNPSFP